MMTKKDFIALADTLADLEKVIQTALEDRPGETKAWARWQSSVTQIRLANFLETQNPRFDRERWLRYIEAALMDA